MPRAIEEAAHHKAYGLAGHVCGDNNVNHLHYERMWLVAFIEAKEQSMDTLLSNSDSISKIHGGLICRGPQLSERITGTDVGNLTDARRWVSCTSCAAE